MSVFYFQAYGLKLSSTVMLPYVPIIPPCSVDVELTQGAVSNKGLNHWVKQGLFWQANTDELWLQVPNIGRFLVQRGLSISFDPEPCVDDHTLAVFLAGPCFSALLMQRDLFVLSGCVVQVKDKAVAYLGERCGKSSLAAAVMQRGYKVLSDQLCVINKDGLVFPGAAALELWPDAAERLSITMDELQSTRPLLKKYYLPLAPFFCEQALPLTQIYALSPQKKYGLTSNLLVGAEKINYLQKNIYNKHYLSGFKKNSLYFHYAAQLAPRLKMHLLEFDGVAFDIQAISNTLINLQESHHDT